ncbi:hypothetical protein [Enterococcus florum]|uniref:hypothetical protein n=1 Tax=Enterococcus florum TaxID=2480627 RepID=UPI0011BA9604|nr:hypothetical protein [Enterococcus florum]
MNLMTEEAKELFRAENGEQLSKKKIRKERSTRCYDFSFAVGTLTLWQVLLKKKNYARRFCLLPPSGHLEKQQLVGWKRRCLGRRRI